MVDSNASAQSETHARAVLAHEIRGALTVIAGFSEMLRREMPDDEREIALAGIGRAVSRIDRLLDSAIGTGAPSKAAPLRLRALAERVAQEQRAITGRSVVVEGVGDPLVNGEPEALERAVGNLLDNALKYSLGSSEVTVSVREEPTAAILEVSDRGPGIAAHDLERVFEPFERAHPADVPGSGLGLTVVRNVAEAYGGTASVHNRSGGGTTFRITLPIAR